MATIAIKARTVGVERIARQFGLARLKVPDDTLDAQRELGRAAEVVFGAHAPFKTGRLVRGIASRLAGKTVVVEAEARNPQSGYDYVAVTRFGHKGEIKPLDPRPPAMVTATHKPRATGSRAALRFVIGGRVFYRHKTMGYHPSRDWAQSALPEIEVEAQRVVTRLGKTIEARFG